MFSLDFTFFWTLVNLLILFFFLKKFLFGRIGAFLEKRAQGIASEREAAESARKEAERLRLQWEEKLAKADEQAAGILQDAKEKAAATGDAIIADARKKAALIITGAHSQIEAEREAALFAFRTQAASLVIQASEKLLKRSLSSEDERAFAAIAAASVLGAQK
jgi:F-type H+-transporting ATPase subunit b